MKQLDVLFHKERCTKDEQYITIYNKYRRNYKVPRHTSKFYATHDHFDLSEAQPELLAEMIRETISSPKQRLKWPETQNQWCGWFNQPFVECNRNDKRFYRPRVQQDCTNYLTK